MEDAEIKKLAADAAGEAVRQTFRMFGVDTNDQESVNNFRSDLVFARDLRKATAGAQNKIMMVIITLVVGAVCVALARGFGFTPKG